MVRIRLWFLLMLFLIYLGSPGYPATKARTRNIHNLPVNQDMGISSQRYSKDLGNRKLLEAMEEDDCPDCWDDLNDAAKCKRCLKLRNNCKDCCLTKNSDGDPVEKCAEDDPGGDYACGIAPFDIDSCEQAACEKGKCYTQCADYKYDADSPCNSDDKGKGTGGAVDGGDTARRWQRKGCPEKESPDLAPDGNCEEVTGSGLDRVWECDASNYQPRFSGCSLDSESKLVEKSNLVKPGVYYSVTKAEASCVPSCEVSQCTVTCSSSSNGKGVVSCKSSRGSCNPGCSPVCVSDIESDDPDARADCKAEGCGAVSSCSGNCSVSGGACVGDNCGDSSNCGSPDCDAFSARWPESPRTFYIYKLSEDFKDYIKDCVSGADEYDACRDRLQCCQKGVCPDETVKKDADTYKCNPGFSRNCKDCNKRICYSEDCADFESLSSAKSCPQLASDVNGCLIDEPDCFKEIDNAFFYPYVASGGDALNIIWQVVTKPPKKVADGLSFYTLVKVWKLDADGNLEKTVHTSMMNVKSLEAAFSIYGTTNVAKDVLESGASYQARLYYFLPPREFCDVSCECPEDDEDCKAQACNDSNEIELTYVSLIVQRIRE